MSGPDAPAIDSPRFGARRGGADGHFGGSTAGARSKIVAILALAGLASPAATGAEDGTGQPLPGRARRGRHGHHRAGERARLALRRVHPPRPRLPRLECRVRLALRCADARAAVRHPGVHRVLHRGPEAARHPRHRPLLAGRHLPQQRLQRRQRQPRHPRLRGQFRAGRHADPARRLPRPVDLRLHQHRARRGGQGPVVVPLRAGRPGRHRQRHHQEPAAALRGHGRR